MTGPEGLKMGQLQELAEKIAVALGTGWTRDTTYDQDGGDWRTGLAGPASQRLFLSNTSAGAGKLHIGGRFPNGGYVREQVKINVSLTKAPERIAHDITRRLLPFYQKSLVIALDRKRRDDEYKAGTDRLAAELSQLIGKELGGQDKNILYLPFGCAEIRGPESIHFKYLDLTPVQFRAVWQALKEIPTNQSRFGPPAVRGPHSATGAEWILKRKRTC